MNSERATLREAERRFRDLFADLAGYRVTSMAGPADDGIDLRIAATSRQARHRFALQARSRITPQSALAVVEQVERHRKDSIPVVYAPIISPRVASILRENDIGYADRAGNCWLRDPSGPLLIDRQGNAAARQSTPRAADPFSPKSSRIVRAMLSNPSAEWQVRGLAALPEVGVSPGLVVKVKRALIEEGYAVEAGGLLRLRDAAGLLEAWSDRYTGPAETVRLYLRGDPDTVEQTVSRWCEKRKVRYALAGLSAAWRLAPEVRHATTSVYLESFTFEGHHPWLKAMGVPGLIADAGARRVDSGANLLLSKAYDEGVFSGAIVSHDKADWVTSPLQTYLDLRQLVGRGDEAARAVYDGHLRPAFEAAAKQEGK